MALRRLWKRLRERVRQSRQDSGFAEANIVAILSGDPLILEAIVRKASMDSGIEMDWSYFAGRAVIVSYGERAKCRSALFEALPNSDLSQEDWIV